jgi:hypothetical protein
VGILERAVERDLRAVDLLDTALLGSELLVIDTP